MDLAAHVALAEAQKGSDDKDEDIVQNFLAPDPGKLPDDGVLKYVVVENVYDLKTVEPGAVVLVGPSAYPMIQLATTNVAIFKRRFVVLAGLPDADYTNGFDRAAWSCDKVAYAALMSELAERNRAELAHSAANESVHDRERRVFTRGNGTVKGHVAEIHRAGDDADEASDETS